MSARAPLQPAPRGSGPQALRSASGCAAAWSHTAAAARCIYTMIPQSHARAPLTAHPLPSQNRSPPVVDPASAGAACVPLRGAYLLALSADQQLLAAGAGRAVHLFSLSQLARGGNSASATAPLHTLDLGSPVVDFAWCPSGAAEDLGSFLALTSDRTLLHGGVGSGAAALAERADAFSWSPDGAHVAYSCGNLLTVTAPDWRATEFRVEVDNESLRECGWDGTRRAGWGSEGTRGWAE